MFKFQIDLTKVFMTRFIFLPVCPALLRRILEWVLPDLGLSLVAWCGIPTWCTFQLWCWRCWRCWRWWRWWRWSGFKCGAGWISPVESATESAVEPFVEVTGEEGIPPTQPSPVKSEEDVVNRPTSPEMPPPPVPVKSLPLPPSSVPSDLDPISRQSALLRVAALKNFSMLEKIFVFGFFPPTNGIHKKHKIIETPYLRSSSFSFPSQETPRRAEESVGGRWGKSCCCKTWGGEAAAGCTHGRESGTATRLGWS